MAIRDLDRKRIERELDAFCDRVPKHIRHQVCHAYRIAGSDVVLFEVRSVWNDPGQSREHPVAKFRFNATRELWQLYCRHRDLKWHSYTRLPAVGSFEILLREVERDPTGIFWG